MRLVLHILAVIIATLVLAATASAVPRTVMGELGSATW